MLKQRYYFQKSTKEMAKSMQIARDLMIELGYILQFNKITRLRQNTRFE